MVLTIPNQFVLFDSIELIVLSILNEHVYWLTVN